jgi:hypothetical protein
MQTTTRNKINPKLQKKFCNRSRKFEQKILGDRT